MDLVHEFEMTAELAPSVPIGPGPFGDRRIRKVTGGTVTGERIRGTIDTGGGDWILTGTDGYGRLDVRLTVNTHDGAHLYVQYFGSSSTTTPRGPPTPASAPATMTSTTSGSRRGSRPGTPAMTGSTGPCSWERVGSIPGRWWSIGWRG
jgi:hypothetical protein